MRLAFAVALNDLDGFDHAVQRVGFAVGVISLACRAGLLALGAEVVPTALDVLMDLADFYRRAGRFALARAAARCLREHPASSLNQRNQAEEMLANLPELDGEDSPSRSTTMEDLFNAVF